MSMTVTNIDTGSLVLERGEFRDELLTFGGAGTVITGTILARDTSTLKLVPFVKGGSTNGNGIPNCVLDNAVVAAGAGDEAVRAMLNGKVRKDKLVIAADADDSNVDAAVIDQLRSFGIITVEVKDLSILDNQ